jgi:hypothetical protein
MRWHEIPELLRVLHRGMPKKNPHGRGLSSGRRPAEARRSDLNLSDVWAVSVDRRSAIEAERGSIGLRAVWHGKGRGHWRGHSLMLPSFVLEPSNGRMHRASAAGHGAIRITNLGTVK